MEKTFVDSSFLRKLERLKLNTNIILNKGYSGSRKSKSKGSSVEFSDYREYSLGDDFRKIDWNAYARFEKLFIKLFMEEREALVNVFVDTSKSMDFGSPKKSLIAQKLALTFGYLSLSNMDRVNIYSTTEFSIDDMGYINGKNNFPRMVEYLKGLKFSGKTSLFEVVEKRPLKKGISIIISDLFTNRFEDTIKYLSYMNQTIIVLHILSKDEINPDISGDVRLIDSETDESKDISISPLIKKNYERMFNEYIVNTKEVCGKYGCLYALVSNDVSIENIVFDSLIKAGILR